MAINFESDSDSKNRYELNREIPKDSIRFPPLIYVFHNRKKEEIMS